MAESSESRSTASSFEVSPLLKFTVVLLWKIMFEQNTENVLLKENQDRNWKDVQQGKGIPFNLREEQSALCWTQIALPDSFLSAIRLWYIFFFNLVTCIITMIESLAPSENSEGDNIT